MKIHALMTKNTFFVLLALVCLFLIHFIPAPASIAYAGGVTLSYAGKSAIGVLVFALILWLTEAVPFHITGFFAIFLLAVLRVESFPEIIQLGFGNHIVVFMFGVLILSAFVNRSGLGKRITLFLLSLTGNQTRAVVFGFLGIGVLLSMWLSNMAVAAMLMPLARGILVDEGVKPLKSNFGRALMIACAWGPAIGGIGTPAGAGPNPLAIGFLKEMAGIDISFLHWTAIGAPAALLLLVPSWFILTSVFPPEIKHLRKSTADLTRDFRELPPMGMEEKITIFVFGLTVLFWIFSPTLETWLRIEIPISMSVMFTAGLFFLPGASKIEWKDIESDINWSGIILVLAGISLGMTLHTTQAARWLSASLLGGIGKLGPFPSILVVILLVSLLKIVFSSNSVTASIVVPLMIGLAQGLNASVLRLVLPAAITSSLGLILVTSAPTNVIPYTAGYFSIADMAKAGVILTVIAAAIVAVAIYLVGNLFGM